MIKEQVDWKRKQSEAFSFSNGIEGKDLIKRKKNKINLIK